ncbi:MAG: glutamate synthase subunit alpha, partial [Acidimicrobiia bacterium]
MRRGLYDPALDHDSCGIGFVANIRGRKSHRIIEQGQTVLTNLTHRGAVGADPLAGDGAGMLVQIPDAFFRSEADLLGFTLPPPGQYGVGMVFLPTDRLGRIVCENAIAEYVVREGLVLLGWRDVPVDSSCLGESVRPLEPLIRQVFIGWGDQITDADEFERKLFVIRKQAHNMIKHRVPLVIEGGFYYVPSLSGRTITYKGMMLAENLSVYYRDLVDPRFESAMALIHQRFSTNTFPSWRLAQPFRFLCHNGEINTLRGNVNWMRARESQLASEAFGADLEKVLPVVGQGGSDSATLDNVFELLCRAGRNAPMARCLL